MMDPKRWTEPNTDSTELERELLTAGQQSALPGELKQEIWAALAQATLPLLPPIQAGPEGSASLTGAGSTGLKLTSAKLVLGLAALGAVSWGGYWAHSRSARVAVSSVGEGRSARAEPSVAPASPEPKAVEPAELTTPHGLDGSVEAAPNRALANPSAAQSPQTLLREESQAVLEIRRVLRAGDASSALRLLERARARFTHPVLGQEREALTVEALARSGARDVAERRAAAFLRAYPKSPYAADVRAFTAR